MANEAEPRRPSTAVRVACIAGGLAVLLPASLAVLDILGHEPPAAEAPPTTTSTTVPGPDPELVAADAALQLPLPDGWVTASPGIGPTGEELFPDDRSQAQRFDAKLEVAADLGSIRYGFEPQTSSQVLVSYIGTRGRHQFVTGVNSGRLNLERADGVVITADEPIEVGTGQGHLFRYRTGTGAQTLDQIQLLVGSETGYYVVLGQSTVPAVIDALIAVAPGITTT